MEDSSSPQQRRLRGLEERQQPLTEKLNRLEIAYDNETDVTQQMRIEKDIASTKQTLSDIAKEITALEIAPLMQQATHGFLIKTLLDVERLLGYQVNQ